MRTYTDELGDVPRRHRRKASISQEELGFRVGIHRTYVGGVERGERNITVLTLRKFALGLNVAPSQILCEVEGGGTEPK